MTREYTLSKKQALGAEASRIDSTGAYVGSITQAFAIKSSKGTEGIELSFKADDGSTAEYLSLYTHNAKGEELRGLRVLNSLMAVLKVKQLQSVRGKYKTRDNGQVVDKEGDVFPNLCARVGLILQREEYVKNDGSLGSRMTLFLPFCANTKRVASEVLAEKPQGEALDKILPTVKDRPAQARQSNARGGGSGAAPTSDDFDDSDIPF